MSKSRKPDGAVKVVAVIGVVRKVEGLEHELQVALFTELNVLCQTGIQVKICIATQVIEGVQATGSIVVSLFRAAWSEKCASLAAATQAYLVGLPDCVVRPRRTELQYRR